MAKGKRNIRWQATPVVTTRTVKKKPSEAYKKASFYSNVLMVVSLILGVLSFIKGWQVFLDPFSQADKAVPYIFIFGGLFIFSIGAELTLAHFRDRCKRDRFGRFKNKFVAFCYETMLIFSLPSSYVLRIILKVSKNKFN